MLSAISCHITGYRKSYTVSLQNNLSKLETTLSILPNQRVSIYKNLKKNHNTLNTHFHFNLR